MHDSDFIMEDCLVFENYGGKKNWRPMWGKGIKLSFHGFSLSLSKYPQINYIEFYNGWL